MQLLLRLHLQLQPLLSPETVPEPFPVAAVLVVVSVLACAAASVYAVVAVAAAAAATTAVARNGSRTVSDLRLQFRFCEFSKIARTVCRSTGRMRHAPVPVLGAEAEECGENDEDAHLALPQGEQVFEACTELRGLSLFGDLTTPFPLQSGSHKKARLKA